MISYWIFKLPISYNNFESIEEPTDVIWHEGPFRGHGAGLVDYNAPEGLQDVILKFDEVKEVHELMRIDPDYFFDTYDQLWMYTGGSGEVPDAIGFSKDGKIIIGEIKWLGGWHKKLSHQIKRYLNLFCGKTTDRAIEIRIAAAQTLSDTTLNKLHEMWRAQASKWSVMTVYFGFLQVGWSKSLPHKYYLRCKWVEQKTK